MVMNVGIITLQDGRPCIVYDEELPHPIRHVAFNLNDHRITLVYDIPGGSREFTQGRKLDYPLDHRFAKLFKEMPLVAVAKAVKGQPIDIIMHLVVLIEK